MREISPVAMAALCSARWLTSLFSVVRLLQRGNVDLVHLQHCVHDALCFRLVLVCQHFDQHNGNDLPRQTEFVLEPAASAFLAPTGKFRPKIIDLLLVLAVHDKRDRFGEFEHRSAVEPDELLSLELELNRHDRSGWPSSC